MLDTLWIRNEIRGDHDKFNSNYLNLISLCMDLDSMKM